MRTVEKKVAYYDKILSFVDMEERDEYIRYIFKDSSNNIWTHDQILVSNAESEEAAKQARIFFAKAASLKVGDKVVTKCCIRQILGGGVYRNVEKIICKM